MPHTLSGSAARSTQTSTAFKSRFRGPSFSTSETYGGQGPARVSRAGFRQLQQHEDERLGSLALTWAWLLVVPVDLIIWALSINDGIDARLSNQLMMLAALLGTVMSVWALLRAPYQHARLLLWLSRLGTLTALVQLVSTFRSLSGHL
ncbi:hypothetical protein [Deinococcus hopiensis]|uniref:Uncharacterized protein n=1 Tax=Deinococcus hopiensis KR-140 TaxID=695939 RepID=A0A1W1VIL7_9DEIO|nr:hypothetical protein [Deinococcus hopiensis]SMB93123.1 hypothetical protein SAMN00790413_01856 [Deinococcus hopiensis KR-140]